MSVLAYEKASAGDNSLIEELTELLVRPYEEQTPQAAEKWYRKTPPWAQDMPGVEFMS